MKSKKILRKEERQRRRDMILDAAERVFTSTPFTEVSVRKIAKEASISPASIYTYFHDQEELFVEICRRRGRDTIELSDKVVNKFKKDSTKETALAYLDYFAEHHTYFRMIAQFMLYAQLRPESAKQLSALQRSVLDYLESALKKNKVSGDTRLLAHVFFAGLNGILVNCPKYPGRTENEITQHIKHLAVALCDLLVTGTVSSDAAIKQR